MGRSGESRRGNKRLVVVVKSAHTHGAFAAGKQLTGDFICVFACPTSLPPAHTSTTVHVLINV